MRSLADAGVTWWVEYVPASELEAMRTSVRRGPPRIDQDDSVPISATEREVTGIPSISISQS
jgi:hypothetical protein